MSYDYIHFDAQCHVGFAQFTDGRLFCRQRLAVADRTNLAKAGSLERSCSDEILGLGPKGASFDHTRDSHSGRTTVSLILARLVQMPEGYWAAIATLVVMQSTLGAALTLSIDRIIATAVGGQLEQSRQIISRPIWSRSRLRFFSSDCFPSRFVCKRPHITTRALR
jgi:fusaric acid resistance family protein